MGEKYLLLSSLGKKCLALLSYESGGKENHYILPLHADYTDLVLAQGTRSRGHFSPACCNVRRGVSGRKYWKETW